MAVLSELRKDFASGEQDSFEVILDTFGDRRNGFMFLTNRGGARSDMQVANEGREVNASWDAVWTVKSQNVQDGWIVSFTARRHDVDLAIEYRYDRGQHAVSNRDDELDQRSPVHTDTFNTPVNQARKDLTVIASTLLRCTGCSDERGRPV